MTKERTITIYCTLIFSFSFHISLFPHQTPLTVRNLRGTNIVDTWKACIHCCPFVDSDQQHWCADRVSRDHHRYRKTCIYTTSEFRRCKWKIRLHREQRVYYMRVRFLYSDAFVISAKPSRSFYLQRCCDRRSASCRSRVCHQRPHCVERCRMDPVWRCIRTLQHIALWS